MPFANPLALFLAVLAVPVVIFYILKIRLRRVPVSTTLFWRQIFEEKQPRSIWQHLRHLISLLLQLAFLLLLVLAISEPFFGWEVREARRVVLVVDNSASMNATDVGPTRLAEAKRRGRELLAGLRERDEAAIVAAGTQPQVVSGVTGHERSLRDALDAIAPTEGPTRIAEAIELARRLIGDHANGEVLVLTDGCFPEAERLGQDGEAEKTRLVVVGSRVGNVGLSRFQVRRSLLDPVGYEILVEVVNQSDDLVECRLEVDLNEDVVDVVPLKLASGEVWSRTLEKTSAEGGELIARIDRDDALAADNTARAVLPKREKQRVILVSERNLFLEKVFEANPLVSLTVTSELPEVIDSKAVLVLHRKVPATLPRGRVFVIDPNGSSDLWDLGENLGNPIVTKQDSESLVMKHVRLDNVLMPEAKRLEFKGPSLVLASSVGGEPLISSISRPEGKVLVLTVNLAQGDLPLRTAFPILATNALGWFADTAGELRESLATGAVTSIDLPESVMTNGKRLPLELLSPGDANSTSTGRAPQMLPPELMNVTVGPLDRCGFWTVAPASVEAEGASSGTLGAPGRTPSASPILEIACNLANREESDLRTPEPLLANAKPSPLTAGLASRSFWFYLTIVAFLLTVTEWSLYQRRWIT
jgi:hypothetical protein